jgi:hypothetical protein
VERETKRTFPDQVHSRTTINTPSTNRRKEPRLRSIERLIQGSQPINRLLRRLFNSQVRPCIVETHWTCGHMRMEIVREKVMITDHNGDNIRRNEGAPHPDISMSNVVRSAARSQTWWQETGLPRQTGQPGLLATPWPGRLEDLSTSDVRKA